MSLSTRKVRTLYGNARDNVPPMEYGLLEIEGHLKLRNSGTERMSAALILRPGTGGLWGAGGVKTAKLCVEQDQIGRR